MPFAAPPQDMTARDTQNREWFELIVEGLPEAILMVDHEQRIAFANRRAHALFGYSQSDLTGQPLEILVPRRGRGAHRDQVTQYLLAPQTRSMGAGRDLRGVRKDGSELPVEIGLNPIRTPEGVFTLASVVDITGRKRAEEIERRMAALVESADDAILTKTLDGIILSWNPGAERLLGYREDQMVGQSVLRLLPEDRQGEEAIILDSIRAGRHVAHFETVRRRRDGSCVDVSLTISPIRDRAGNILGASKIMRDITERKRTQEELIRANAKLEQINSELEDFVYTASHDLRSPLTGVNSVVTWILEDDASLSAESRERLLLIRGRVERMKRLLSDIQEYARSGEFQSSSEEGLSAAALLADVVATSHVPPGFSIRLHPQLEGVKVLRMPLERIFHNLINNALKHHDRSTGTVEVAVEPGEATVTFSVSDDGPGIPEEHREAIFEMFKTLRPRDAVEGSGMGLALVRKLVARAGGRCGVRAAGARGSDFWFEWPRLT